MPKCPICTDLRAMGEALASYEDLIVFPDMLSQRLRMAGLAQLCGFILKLYLLRNSPKGRGLPWCFMRCEAVFLPVLFLVTAH